MVKKKDPAAVALGRKGGRARSKNLTAEERGQSARRAALARWKNSTPEERLAQASKAGRASAAARAKKPAAKPAKVRAEQKRAAKS